MADFLSAEWFAALNQSLAAAGTPPIEQGDDTFRVVMEFTDGPATSPHAITFSVDPDGAVVAPGDHLAANAVLRMSYADATALTNGSLESGGALREGRFKVRGDVHGLVPLLGWLLQAHPH